MSYLAARWRGGHLQYFTEFVWVHMYMHTYYTWIECTTQSLDFTVSARKLLFSTICGSAKLSWTVCSVLKMALSAAKRRRPASFKIEVTGDKNERKSIYDKMHNVKDAL